MEETKMFSMRLRDETRRKLEELARLSHRDLSGQIHWLIDSAYSQVTPAAPDMDPADRAVVKAERDWREALAIEDEMGRKAPDFPSDTKGFEGVSNAIVEQLLHQIESEMEK